MYVNAKPFGKALNEHRTYGETHPKEEEQEIVEGSGEGGNVFVI